MLNMQSFRKTKKDEIATTTVYLTEVLTSVNEIQSEVQKLVSELAGSDLAPHRIAQTLSESEMSQINSLALVHKGMYKINDLQMYININLLPRLVEEYSDAESVVSTVKMSLTNDDVFNRITSSNAERNREADFILMGINKSFSKLKTKYKITKDLITYLGDMSSYINRLDSMIRLKEKIIQSAEFESASANGSKILNMSIGG